MSGSPLKIVYVTGWCRNGSTIIGNILGEIPGFFHVGELHFLWKNAAGQGANSRCGCGLELTQCPIWSQLIATSRPADYLARQWADTVIGRQQAYVRTRHTWRVLSRGLHCDGIREHAALMAQTYQAIADLTAARVIVDTSKIGGEAALLPRLAGITPYFVHLVRDPRAVAQSWSQPKDYCYVMSSFRSTAYWHGFNLASRAITRRYPDRSCFLRYEDFIADPAAAISALLRMCGIDSAANPMDGRLIELHANHTVTGNPDRFRTGATIIRESDDSWKTGLSAPAKLTAATVSWPLSWRYGYGNGGGTFLASRRGGGTATPRAASEQ